MENEHELTMEKLLWARQRMTALTEIGIKLNEMKYLAEFARDHSLTKLELFKLNSRIQLLQQSVIELDRQTANYPDDWLDDDKLLAAKTLLDYLL